jgi:hypothetical protein
MRIIDAAPELVADILQEMQVSDSRKKSSYLVQVGLHPTLGRIVVISTPKGDATIVEMTGGA